MRFLYLFSCLTVAAGKACAEPPVFMGLKQQDERALPLKGHAVEPLVYQQLPLEHSFVDFLAPPLNYGAPDYPPYFDTMAPALPETTTAKTVQEDSYNAAHRHSSSQQHQTGYNKGPTETQVHKYIYVHVPPKEFEEEDAVQARVTHQSGKKQKHYKIVFIKAPAAPAVHVPLTPPLPQNEEKTLIYVLHKRPESEPEIVIPTPEPTKPSKPEVYFIKYRTKSDEAPVYGPPPPTNDAKARQADDSAPTEVNNFVPLEFTKYELVATTIPPKNQEKEVIQQPQLSPQPQFIDEVPLLGDDELYSAPTANNIIMNEISSTTVGPVNSYLSPETTLAPIVVKEMEEPVHLPSTNYGTPHRSRYFVKRRK